MATNRVFVDRLKAIIDTKIEQEYKPGESLVVFLKHGYVPAYLCDALRSYYFKKGWKVCFPSDSRGDGGYIELKK